jgi:uncharacterized protein YigE (DUF2233 family)
MRRLFAFILAGLLASMDCNAATLASYADGDQAIDVCRVDLTRDQVRTFWRDTHGDIMGRVDTLRDRLAVNGEVLACASNAGIFAVDRSPIGLYIEGGKVLHKLNTRKGAYGNFYMQPNGAFLIAAGQAEIVHTDVLAEQLGTLLPTISYASQSGPMLVLDGQINPSFVPESPNRLVRNGVCVIGSQDIALVRSHAAINFYDFARLMRDKLHCRNALYFDGTVSRLYPYDHDAEGDTVGPMIGVTSHTK